MTMRSLTQVYSQKRRRTSGGVLVDLLIVVGVGLALFVAAPLYRDSVCRPIRPQARAHAVAQQVGATSTSPEPGEAPVLSESPSSSEAPATGTASGAPVKEEEGITVAEVAANKNLWPRVVACTRPIRIDGSTSNFGKVSFPIGTMLHLNRVKENELDVNEGPHRYRIPPAATDLLRRAKELKASVGSVPVAPPPPEEVSGDNVAMTSPDESASGSAVKPDSSSGGPPGFVSDQSSTPLPSFGEGEGSTNKERDKQPPSPTPKPVPEVSQRPLNLDIRVSTPASATMSRGGERRQVVNAKITISSMDVGRTGQNLRGRAVLIGESLRDKNRYKALLVDKFKFDLPSRGSFIHSTGEQELFYESHVRDKYGFRYIGAIVGVWDENDTLVKVYTPSLTAPFGMFRSNPAAIKELKEDKEYPDNFAGVLEKTGGMGGLLNH